MIAVIIAAAVLLAAGIAENWFHQKALARRVAASEPDRMEQEAESFHARTEAAYHELISRDPERFITVNAEQSREEIAEEIRRRVLPRLMEAET